MGIHMMKYTNPVLKGFYPDPSVCEAEGKFYLACSSFQYFPGVPLFESRDLVNWTQIGHVLTRESQVMLDKVPGSGGVFAPTLRYYQGRFYMTTNNNTTQENFYVYTDDIYGEWSDPITVEMDGIDPSLYFEDGRAYYMTNGTDDQGQGGIVQCEIDIATGKKLSESRVIWKGSGGRYLESPHLYKIGEYYYVMAAEGGTEYGHMVTYARSKSLWGPFEDYPTNPVLTNRNKAPYIIQGIGHGDLVRDHYGSWHILCLGFRQIHIWQPYHHLGREVFLMPVAFREDGWFTAGRDGTAEWEYEMPGEGVQQERKLLTFANTDWNKEWVYLRHPRRENYELGEERLLLKGTEVTLDERDTPTFLGIRQTDMDMELSFQIVMEDREDVFDPEKHSGEAGVTMYMTEDEHYDLAVRRGAEGYEAVLKLNIGGIKHLQNAVKLTAGSAKLLVRSDGLQYLFYVVGPDGEKFLGSAQTKYLSSEVAAGFTGVVMGLYAIGGQQAEFTEFAVRYGAKPY